MGRDDGRIAQGHGLNHFHVRGQPPRLTYSPPAGVVLSGYGAQELLGRAQTGVTALVPAPTPVRPKSSALLAAAGALLPALEAGRALDAPVLRQAMTGAFGASDSDGGLGLERRLRGGRGGAGTVHPALWLLFGAEFGRRSAW